DGTLDTSFGVGGKAINVAPGMRFLNGAMLSLPDGKILTAGSGFNGVALSFEVVRLNADGSLDTTFGSGGTVFTNFGGNGDPYAIARQSDGKIVVAGYHADATTGAHTLALARYTADGVLDPTFGTGGIVQTTVNGADDALDMLVQPDGRIVLAGRTTVK